MTYGVFNLDSGNLIESFRTERRALEFVADMPDDDHVEPDEFGLVAFDRGAPAQTLSGDELREAAAAHRRNT